MISKELFIKLIDIYYKYYLIIDIILCSIIVYIGNKFCLFQFQTQIDNIIFSFIETLMSLSGFILASLAIIISIKNSNNNKNEYNNKLISNFFNSKYYKIILLQFYQALFIFIIIGLVLYISLFIMTFDEFLKNLIVVCFLFFSMAILRCIFLLKKIINFSN